MSWWLRRIARPWETARVLAPSWLPLGWRRRLLAVSGGGRAPDRSGRERAVRDWVSELEQLGMAAAEPAIVSLGPPRGGAVPDPAPPGWRVLELPGLSGDDVDAGQVVDAVVGLRRDQRVHEAVVMVSHASWAPAAAAVSRRFGWPVAEPGVALPGLFPRVSILVVTHENAAMTGLCLDSVRAFTAYPNLELVVVDNGSAGDTREVLAQAQVREPRLLVINNVDNRGFAAACNQAARQASGDVLVFLNNDTVVAPGWLWVLVRALDDASAGMVGPVTNAIANEARVRTGYRSLSEMLQWADAATWRHDGKRFEMRMLALYCAAMRREVLHEVGELDEGFGLGMFEDDDLCRRLRRSGLRLWCRRDSFVHHWQQASFDLLDPDGYADLYERNRAYYRRKWARR